MLLTIRSRDRSARPRITIAKVAELELGGDDRFVAATAERLTDVNLGLPVTVCVGGVDEVDSQVETPMDDRGTVATVGDSLRMGEVDGTDANDGDAAEWMSPGCGSASMEPAPREIAPLRCVSARAARGAGGDC